MEGREEGQAGRGGWEGGGVGRWERGAGLEQGKELARYYADCNYKDQGLKI